MIVAQTHPRVRRFIIEHILRSPAHRYAPRAPAGLVSAVAVNGARMKYDAIPWLHPPVENGVFLQTRVYVNHLLKPSRRTEAAISVVVGFRESGWAKQPPPEVRA